MNEQTWKKYYEGDSLKKAFKGLEKMQGMLDEMSDTLKHLEELLEQTSENETPRHAWPYRLPVTKRYPTEGSFFYTPAMSEQEVVDANKVTRDYWGHPTGYRGLSGYYGDTYHWILEEKKSPHLDGASTYVWVWSKEMQ